MKHLCAPMARCLLLVFILLSLLVLELSVQLGAAAEIPQHGRTQEWNHAEPLLKWVPRKLKSSPPSVQSKRELLSKHVDYICSPRCVDQKNQP